MITDKHRPPHIYLDNTNYFITIGTFRKSRLFNNDIKKQFIKSALDSAIKKFGYILHAWVILDNHFHILIKALRGELLPRFIGSVTGKSAIELNKLDKISGRQCWYQYWDRCIRNEADFWRRMNYTHYNPVKHSYVSLMGEYLFSSYRDYLGEQGQRWIDNCFEKYSVIDFTMKEDGF